MKHVLITGGSDGLGRAIAKKLIEAGFKVTILASDANKTKAAAQELNCGFVVADVGDYAAVEKAIKQASEQAPIDVLINNAGLWIQDALDANDPEKIKKVIEVNVMGVINCTKAVMPAMKQRRSGRIINVSSQGGLYAKPERGPYTASKWAVTGFTKAMQTELKPFNIAVTGLYPGALKDTNIFKVAGNDRDMSKALDPAFVADAVVYICKLPDGVNVPEFGIVNLEY